MTELPRLKKRVQIKEVLSTLKDKEFAKIIPLPLIKGFVIGFYTTYLGEIVRICLIAEDIPI